MKTEIKLELSRPPKVRCNGWLERGMCGLTRHYTQYKLNYEKKSLLDSSSDRLHGQLTSIDFGLE